VSAAPFSVTPFAGAAGGIDGPFVAEGTPAGFSESPTLSIEVVSPGYFDTFGIPIRGRGFVAEDVGESPRVAVIGDSVAQLFWPGQDAVGKRLAMGRPRKADDWWTVVGVVPPTRYRALREPAPTVYLSYRQFMGGMLAAPRRLAVRTSGAPEAVVPAVRQAAREIDADVVVSRAEKMERIVAAQLAQPRFNALLLTVFGTGALALAAVGVYAVLAYVVRRRTRELAIRHALGATPARLRSLVLREAVLMAGGGAALGLAGALAGGRLIRSLLFGVTPGDPATLGSVAALLIAVALGAASAPALRAARVDPAVVLRAE
jgi:hypothetical protein